MHRVGLSYKQQTRRSGSEGHREAADMRCCMEERLRIVFEVSSLRNKSSTKLPPEKDQSEALRVVRGLSASDLHKSRL